MEASVESKAAEEFENIARLWPNEVRCAERRLTHEEEAAELVYNFLIPEVSGHGFCIYTFIRRAVRLHCV